MLSTTIRPRFCDTDALGHINNTVVPVWFLEAREPVLRMFVPEGNVRHGGIAVVRIEVDYLGEIRFGENVEVRTLVDHIGNSSFRLAQQLWQDGALRARGLATLVHFNAETRRSGPIPPQVRDQLAEHMEAEGGKAEKSGG